MANERFDKEAAEWDNNPFTVASSKYALDALRRYVPGLSGSVEGSEIFPTLDVLEIGCGTGLLSLLVAPLVHHLTAIDTSEGMIRALEAKLASPSCSLTNIRPLCLLLEDADDPALQIDGAEGKREKRRFDLIISHLVLHHVPSLPSILATMHACLKPGGSIALTDFENFGPEARKFHPEDKMDGVERHGIQRGEMEELLQRAGFVDVKVEVAWRMEKFVEGDREGPGEAGFMAFPFLICLGRREG